MIEWFFDHYFGTAWPIDDPRAIPALYHDYTGLPPALIITAGHDPLRDEGAEYAERLEAAGVRGPVRMLRRHDPRLYEHGTGCCAPRMAGHANVSRRGSPGVCTARDRSGPVGKQGYTRSIGCGFHLADIEAGSEHVRSMPEAELRQLLHEHGFTISHMSYRQNDKGAVFEYRMVIGTTDQDTLRKLATSLRKMRNLLSFASLRRATRPTRDAR